MKLVVYVEGASDVASMRSLFADLIASKREEGIGIEFAQAPPGDKKITISTKVPKKAVDIICSDPSYHVVAIPDLYPPKSDVPYRTAEELQHAIRQVFVEAMKARRGDDDRLLDHFHVFCFKYDLEALILAAEEQLANRLGVRKVKRTWTEWAEDQNHDRPPKFVVRDLFHEHGDCYDEAVDAPLILGDSDYRTLAERCPQCFAPFVDFLTSLTPLDEPASAT